MRTRHFKFWLVLLNLLAFNAYALNAVSAFVPHRPAAQVAHTETTYEGCHQAVQSAAPIHQHSSEHCDMPCCKGGALGTIAQADPCGCKLGHSGIMQLQDIGSVDHVYLEATFALDAMPTALIVQDRAQRLLRPPIQ